VKLIFLDQLGCYASVVAAAYYAGILQGKVTYQEILTLPYFGAQGSNQPGELYEFGEDGKGRKLYTLSVGNYGPFINGVLWPEMLKLLQTKEQIVLYDLSFINPFLLNLLGTILRRRLRGILKLVWAYYLAKKMPLLVKVYLQEMWTPRKN